MDEDTRVNEPSDQKENAVSTNKGGADSEKRQDPVSSGGADAGESLTSDPSVTDFPPDPSKKSAANVLNKVPKPALIGAALVVVILAVLFSTHVICFHDWTPATCTSPETCSLCGETQGAALGHEWGSATCTYPKRCSRCDETQGAALGHEWGVATCTAPKTCSRCGEKEGSALGHDVEEWTLDKASTCSEVGKEHGECVRCGETVNREVPLVDHTEGEWAVSKAPTVSSLGTVTPGERTKSCTVCGKVLSEEPIELEVTTSQKNALRSAASYLSFMAFSHSGLIDQLEYEGYSTEDATFAADYCGADWNEQAAKSAQSYLDFMGFSRSGLIQQLQYEGYTYEQAVYGVDSVGL